MTTENKDYIILRRLEETDDITVYTFLQGIILDKPNLEFFTYTKEDYERKFSQVREGDNYREFEVLKAVDKRRIGIAVIYSIDYENRNGEIRVSLIEECEQGLLIDVLKKVINYCFDNLNLRKVIGYLPEKNKFKDIIDKVAHNEGILRNSYFSHGEIQNLLIYGVLKGESDG